MTDTGVGPGSTAQADAHEPWRDRVVERGVRDPALITANPRNWRRHPLEQRVPFVASLSAIGWVTAGVLVNRRLLENGWYDDLMGEVLLDGHARVNEAVVARQPTVPVTVVELSPGEEAAVLATLDPVAALAVGDAGAYAELAALCEGAEPALAELIAATQDELWRLAEQGDLATGDVRAPGSTDNGAAPDHEGASGAAVRRAVVLEGAADAIEAGLGALVARGVRWWDQDG